MCLAAFAFGASERFPLVIASNRDEFHTRPTQGLAWWPPTAEGAEILAGRDLQAGGTWMGLSAAGRLALLTNIRAPARQRADAPSRGGIVTRWLAGGQAPDRFWMQTALAGHNAFNLVAADFSLGSCHWMSTGLVNPQRLETGVFGLSNGRLDEPWPKVNALKAQLSQALAQADRPGGSPESLAADLLGALGDTAQAADAQLPATGVPLELERQLSAIFIRTPDGRYGTRCSTVLVTERRAAGLVTTVWERSHPMPGSPDELRRVSLVDWPPRSHLSPGAGLLQPLGAQGGERPNKEGLPARPAATRHPVVTTRHGDDRPPTGE